MNYASHVWESVQKMLDRFVLGERDYDAARLVVPFFYYLLFFSAFTHIEGLNFLISQDASTFAPRWPLSWTEGLAFSDAVTYIFLISVLTALLGAAFPYSRAARVLAFAGVLTYHAYLSSFGGPNHQFDYFLWVSFILIFLPRLGSEPSRDARRSFSLVFWCAQAYLLLTYSMAGFLKLFYGVLSASGGEASIFSSDAGALHIATQLLLMNESVPLARPALEFPLVTYMFFLAVLYVQFFALLVAFRPHLHRVWGIALVLFHLGTFLTMRAIFTAPAVLVMVFLLSSPFAPRFAWKETLRSLPLVPSLRKFYASIRFARRRHSDAADSS